MTPASPSVAKGSTQHFTATGIFSDMTTQDLTGSVTWASGTPATATISNASGSSGLATSLAAGTTAITAALGGVTFPGDTLPVTPAGHVLHFGGGIVEIPGASTLNNEKLYMLEGWISEDSPGGGVYQDFSARISAAAASSGCSSAPR